MKADDGPVDDCKEFWDPSAHDTNACKIAKCSLCFWSNSGIRVSNDLKNCSPCNKYAVLWCQLAVDILPKEILTPSHGVGCTLCAQYIEKQWKQHDRVKGTKWSKFLMKPIKPIQITQHFNKCRLHQMATASFWNVEPKLVSHSDARPTDFGPGVPPPKMWVHVWNTHLDFMGRIVGPIFWKTSRRDRVASTFKAHHSVQNVEKGQS